MSVVCLDISFIELGWSDIRILIHLDSIYWMCEPTYEFVSTSLWLELNGIQTSKHRTIWDILINARGRFSIVRIPYHGTVNRFP